MSRKQTLRRAEAAEAPFQLGLARQPAEDDGIHQSHGAPRGDPCRLAPSALFPSAMKPGIGNT